VGRAGVRTRKTLFHCSTRNTNTLVLFHKKHFCFFARGASTPQWSSPTPPSQTQMASALHGSFLRQPSAQASHPATGESKVGPKKPLRKPSKHASTPKHSTSQINNSFLPFTLQRLTFCAVQKCLRALSDARHHQHPTRVGFSHARLKISELCTVTDCAQHFNPDSQNNSPPWKTFGKSTKNGYQNPSRKNK
jgi:hypothetical protein